MNHVTFEQVLAMAKDFGIPEAQRHEWAVKNHVPFGRDNPHPMRYELSRPWLNETRVLLGWITK